MAIMSNYGEILGFWYNPGYSLTTFNTGNDYSKISEYSRLNDVKIITGDGDNTYSGLPTPFKVNYPYPNPSDGTVSLFFTIPVNNEVSIWVVPASAGNITADNNTYLPGHVFMSEKHKEYIVVELLNGLYAPGHHSIIWNGLDYNNNPVPAGFYRIYFRLGKYFTYRDIFIYRKLSDLPENLRKYVPYQQHYHY